MNRLPTGKKFRGRGGEGGGWWLGIGKGEEERCGGKGGQWLETCQGQD